jgi:ATP-dependent Clp protease ATP-binding subunit ClpC
MLIRLGISPSFLSEIASSDKNDIQKIWDESWVIYKKLGTSKISAPILVVALIRQASNYKSLINHLQLDDDDLINGIKWYEHLNNIINEAKRPKKTGGIARDWSFGYTPLLGRFTTNISQQIGARGMSLIELESHKSALEQLENIFSSQNRQNAVLVGPDGVGKTEIVHAFAIKLLQADSELPDRIKFNQVFLLDAAALISSASKRGELEELIPQIMQEAYRAKNIVLFLDNAQLFFEDGIGSVDLTNILQPIIESGGLRIILAMNDQQYLKIVKRNPTLEGLVNKIVVEPATEVETIAIMQDKVMNIEYRNNVTFMYQALKEIYKLCERYVYDLAMPGKVLQLIEASVRYPENGLITVKSVDRAIEESLGVKIGSVDGQLERDQLINMESLIHRRMVGQERAVKVVCDAIRRARTGVRNQNRPIGAFLFVGPTGVGKTELSKALSEVYFGGEDHLIRLDMNEFSNKTDADRLIEDAATNSHSLTSMVIKRPFSVILLDEIEKADPSVLLMLLQMLDEGILRDSSNRKISFRDSIIIATSNAGAEIIREYMSRGYDLEKFENEFVDNLIKTKQFRPEFLNRFDEIVMFKPLESSDLLNVVDFMIANINKTLALKKITVNVDVEAKKYLVEVGNDPKLGARPMQRIIQRAVENIVANQMLAGEVESGSVVNINLEQIKKMIDSKTEAQRIIDQK